MKHNYTNLKDLQPDQTSCLYQRHIKNTFHASLGVKLLVCEPGYCRTRTKIEPQFTNATGAVHGGFLFTVADTTAGLAAIRSGTEGSVTTVDSHIQYLRPALNLTDIYAEAEIIKDGKRLAFIDVKIFTEEGVLLVKGSFTFARLVLPNSNVPTEDDPCNCL